MAITRDPYDPYWHRERQRDEYERMKQQAAYSQQMNAMMNVYPYSLGSQSHTVAEKPPEVKQEPEKKPNKLLLLTGE